MSSGAQVRDAGTNTAALAADWQTLLEPEPAQEIPGGCDKLPDHAAPVVTVFCRTAGVLLAGGTCQDLLQQLQPSSAHSSHQVVAGTCTLV